MLIKDKINKSDSYRIKKIKIGQKTFIYRRENEAFWLYYPQNIEFHKFNKDGFALLLCITKEKFNPELIKRIRKSNQAQKLLEYFINHELTTKKHLEKLGLL